MTQPSRVPGSAWTPTASRSSTAAGTRSDCRCSQRRTLRTRFSTASRRSRVDPREQLRRYLEQRREMGESELVLDSLTVEEALRIVAGGAASSGAKTPPSDARPPGG